MNLFLQYLLMWVWVCLAVTALYHGFAGKKVLIKLFDPECKPWEKAKAPPREVAYFLLSVFAGALVASLTILGFVVELNLFFGQVVPMIVMPFLLVLFGLIGTTLGAQMYIGFRHPRRSVFCL